MELAANMSTKVINLVRDFTSAPGARFKWQGKYSGEALREDLLVPALKISEVIVDLNGALGLPPSFLDEAFGILLERDPDSAWRIHLQLDDNPMAKTVLQESVRRRVGSEIADRLFIENLQRSRV